MNTKLFLLSWANMRGRPAHFMRTLPRLGRPGWAREVRPVRAGPYLPLLPSRASGFKPHGQDRRTPPRGLLFADYNHTWIQDANLRVALARLRAAAPPQRHGGRRTILVLVPHNDCIAHSDR